jgi:hypothetical protein
VRQAEALQRRGRTRLDQHAAGRRQPAVLEWEDGRAPQQAQRAEHVAHAEERLVEETAHNLKRHWSPRSS